MILDARSLVTNPDGNRPMNPALLLGWAIHYTVTDVNGPAVPDEQATEEQERGHIRAIDEYHESIDYGGFAYHYIVYASGRAYWCGEGQRAHVAKRNHQLRGIAFAGTFTDTLPTDAAFAGLREVLLAERAVYGPKEVRGHREWALPGEGTACPGMIVPFDWEAFLAPPAVTLAGVGIHFTDGSDREIWNAQSTSQVPDGLGVRYSDGRQETIWP